VKLNDEIKEEARQLNKMINELSLFTRRTVLEWLPGIASQAGLTPERFMVMFELEMQPEISLKDLAKCLVVSPSSLSVMINAMVEQGIVTRVTDPADRRRIILHLSDVGREKLQHAENRLEEHFYEYLLSLSEKDRQDLDDASKTMMQVIERLLERA
jgi:DNA-binding MarR family transcriptional regulator